MGLGDIIGLWVSTGENKAISLDQLQNAFGSDKEKDIAAKLGIDPNSALSQLSKILPQAVD